MYSLKDVAFTPPPRGRSAPPEFPSTQTWLAPPFLQHPPTHPSSAIASKTVLKITSEVIETATADLLSATQPQTVHKSRFVILGPNPPQYFEASSSESSSSNTTHPLSPPFLPERLSRSTNPSPTHLSLLSGPACHRDTQSPSEQSEQMDWVEYQMAVPEMEGFGRVEGDSDWSDGGTGEGWDRESMGGREAVLMPQSERPNTGARRQLTFQDITELLNRPASTSQRPTPPNTPPRLSASTCSNITLVPQSPISKPQPSTYVEHLIQGGDEEFTLPVKTSVSCAACGREEEIAGAKKMMPCEDITCSACFSSTLSAVSVTKGHTKCPACLDKIMTFTSVSANDAAAAKLAPFNQKSTVPEEINRFLAYPIPVAKRGRAETVVMRIDNVAWDMTPVVVEAFLPPDTLSKTVPQPIHILLDRFDGRTKDYLYIEVASQEASQLILKTRQNKFMPSGATVGGRNRPVTITPVTHNELITELRPRSSQELHSLLALCQASASSGYGPKHGITKFIKSRHGPFYALMSILSKLTGRQSPAYWDLFYVASGAITALANAISRRPRFSPDPYLAGHPHAPIHCHSDIHKELNDGDEMVRDKMLTMFQRCFGMMPHGN